MMSLNRYRLKHLKGTGHRGARRAIRLLQRPDRLIGLILIGNNLVNILASAIATVIAIRLFGDAGIAIATLALTLVILIFAEITPKTVAALHPERIAFPASWILLPLQKLLMPLVLAINWLTNGILKLLGFSPDDAGDDAVSQEELRTIVTESASMIPSRHRRMLVNILDLEQMTVNDIMAPRNEIYGIDIEAPDEAIMRQLKNSAHTRLPIYRDDINLRPVLPEAVTDIGFDLNRKIVVLVDDVLFTGRTIRAALDAIIDQGRPRVETQVVAEQAPRLERGTEAMAIVAELEGEIERLRSEAAAAQGMDAAAIRA